MRLFRNFTRVLLIVFFIIGGYLYISGTAQAYYGLDSGQAFLDSTASETGIDTEADLNVQAARLAKSLFSVVGIAFLILMVYGGFTWMTARGEEEKIGTAKKNIFTAIIGMTIMISAYAITQLILSGILGG